ncbi:MAG TPA: polyprenyl synthetase family protein [Candidatus Binatia bacterium]|nr:polyprenyl synthetase family protein [Candidatus Binatia bacterium]
MFASTRPIVNKLTKPFPLASSEDNSRGFLPYGAELHDLLGSNINGAVVRQLEAALLHPIRDLTEHHGKRIRGQLVILSHRLVGGVTPPSLRAEQQLRICVEAVESIHAASLVVDDIEDGSRTRRGRLALHVRYGMPVALNAGNWLYFWPFEMLKKLELSQEKLLFVYEHYHRTLLRAHFGQALDLGSQVDRLPPDEIGEVCRASMLLKTGALIGFAVSLGGLMGGASERVLRMLDDFGRDLGVALQMFDDLGNIVGRCEPSKQYEDLMLYRPSWAWACAAETSSIRDFSRFVCAVRKLPVADDLRVWLEDHDLVALGRQRAHDHMSGIFQRLEQQLNGEPIAWSEQALGELRKLGKEIAVAYG